LPELPAARAERLQSAYGLASDRAHDFAFRTELGDYFEQAVNDGDGVDPVELANWIPQLVERIGSETDPGSSSATAASLAALARMVSEKEISRGTAREVLTALVSEGGDPRTIVEAKGLGALGGDSEVAAAVDAAIASDPAAADEVRTGNQKAMGPLIAAVMRETKGRADGGEVRRLLLERLAGG
jgi:aspartyl-tRNA(Asn)/glutamyl-tRNA(Gln) amidotransferase subunit B